MDNYHVKYDNSCPVTLEFNFARGHQRNGVVPWI